MHDDVTICIPTFPGRENFVKRAVASARDQAQVVVYSDPYQPPARDRAYLTWWEAVYRAETPFVTLLYDDDWLEPNFVNVLRPMMLDDVGYVVSEANIVKSDGSSRTNLDWPEATGFLDSRAVVAARLLRMSLTISPSCCMFRRQDLLSSILVGGVPMWRQSDDGFANAGSDLLAVLLPVLTYPRVGWVKQPLVNLDAGSQSTTISALETEESAKALWSKYAEARSFFKQLVGLAQ